MKSSSSQYVPAEHLRGAEVWAPSGFEPVENSPADSCTEEVLAILSGRFSGKDFARPKVNGSFIPSTVGKSFDCWAPEEINWVPPFQTAVWNSWDELHRPHPASSPIPEPGVQPNQLSPEEEMADFMTAARRRAEEIIIAAQQNADETIQQAQDEISKSIEDGYRQGWEKAQAEAVTVFQAAHQVVAELIQWRENMLANSENSMLDMLRDIARFMFGDGVKLDEMGMQMNLSRILENAKSLGDVRIFLNPGDAIRLDPAWKEYQNMLTGNKVIIVPSDSIKPGGCFVQGETGSIDARVEAQLSTVLGVLSSKGDVD